ncbi:hypothetical protein [Salinibacterium sp. ZJ77]|uniref:hypothetical protein n=1 Tax=Salinibacterium sp. ZJ77 TaxID=2708337 RepID=UPI0014243527|nr:hypothetical protein [Salinibacterium sp. ZJ77]
MTDDLVRLASDLVDEFRHNYPHGRTTFAVDALPGDDVMPLVEAVAEEFEARGLAVSRIGIPDDRSADAFLALILPAFRTDADMPADAVLVAHGTGLHAPGIVDVWSISVWATSTTDPDPDDPQLRRYLREVDPPRRSDVIIDVSDPLHPVRRFADWCAVPRHR